MALKEVSLIGEPEQLSFKAFELADIVAELLSVEAEKKYANEDFNARIKACKRSIAQLSGEIKAAKR